MAIPTGTPTTTSSISNLVQAAYDQYVRMALRSIPVMRSLADVKPVQQAMPGSSVVFSIYSDLAQATSTLTEASDVSSIALGNPSQVTVTLNEYGSAVTTTKKLNLTSFNDVDSALADIIAYNAADSIDNVVGQVLSAGTNVIYSNGPSGTAPTASSGSSTSRHNDSCRYPQRCCITTHKQGIASYGRTICCIPTPTSVSRSSR
jgi:N4-gp56 family major capsid protein